MQELLGNWVGALVSMVDMRLAAVGGDHGSTDIGAVLTCFSFPDVTVSELGKVLGLTNSGAVRLVNRLERDGLLARQERQGRVVTVKLTDHGRRLAKDLQRRRLAVVDDLLSSLVLDERQQLAVMLDKVLHDARLEPEQARRACRFCDHRCCDGDACPIGRSVRERGQATQSGAMPGMGG